MIKIDKGVPIPALGRAPKYPWREMEIGDSFLMGSSSKDAAVQASRAGANCGRKFSVRAECDKKTRVWRIA